MADQNTNWRFPKSGNRFSNKRDNNRVNKRNKREDFSKDVKGKQDNFRSGKGENYTKYRNEEKKEVNKPDFNQKDLFPSLNPNQPTQKKAPSRINQSVSWVNLAKKTKQSEEEWVPEESRKELRGGKQTEVEDWTERPKDETPLIGTFINHQHFHDNLRSERQYRQYKRDPERYHEVPLPLNEEEEEKIEYMKESEYWDKKYEIEIQKRVNDEMDYDDDDI